MAMDSDEFDDDIADEDLILVASQAPGRLPSTTAIVKPSALDNRQRVRDISLTGQRLGSGKV